MLERTALTSPRILAEGRNCWKRVHADRVAFLVDGKAYYHAFRQAAIRAKRSILMLGWDFNSRERLEHDGDPGPWPNEFAPFIDALVRRRRRLEAHVLNWDFAMLYVLEREPLPVLKMDWRTHRRFHFQLDGNHPPGASHHHKVVVIDDRVAFLGGMDITNSRWDTPEHRAEDPRRVNPFGRSYRPFHDVQVAVSGEAARPLGDLARERWLRATGERIRPPRVENDPWPEDLEPDLTDVTVAIARTDPEWDGRPAILEVEALHLDAIAAARRSIFIENQYFTSGRIGTALAKRLREPDGPEVVLVVPQRCSGWLEEATMGVARARLLARLARADRFRRLRVYYPAVPGLDDGACVNVHSKVLVIDDAFARVGTANMSNRSMRLDTECDLAIEAEGDPRIEAAIARFRNRLLAEHLGATPEAVAGAIAAHGSLIRAVESLRKGERTLEPLEAEADPVIDHLAPDSELLDLERPVSTDLLAERLAPTGPALVRWSRWPFVLGAVALVIGGLVAAARLVPAGTFDAAGWLDRARALEGTPLAPLAVVAVYTVAGAVLTPVLLLITLTGLAFGPLRGFAYAALGVVGSACLFYGLGRLLGRETVSRWASPYVRREGRRLGRHGILAFAAVRLLPVAPFTIVNLMSGALRVPFRDFSLGTLLGTAPGTFVLVVLGDRARAAWREPGVISIATLAAVALIVAAGMLWRRLKARRGGVSGPAAPEAQPARD
jgi:phospholipase D1/2